MFNQILKAKKKKKKKKKKDLEVFILLFFLVKNIHTLKFFWAKGRNLGEGAGTFCLKFPHIMVTEYQFFEPLRPFPNQA